MPSSHLQTVRKLSVIKQTHILQYNRGRGDILLPCHLGRRAVRLLKQLERSKWQAFIHFSHNVSGRNLPSLIFTLLKTVFHVNYLVLATWTTSSPELQYLSVINIHIYITLYMFILYLWLLCSRESSRNPKFLYLQPIGFTSLFHTF